MNFVKLSKAFGVILLVFLFFISKQTIASKGHYKFLIVKYKMSGNINLEYSVIISEKFILNVSNEGVREYRVSKNNFYAIDYVRKKIKVTPINSLEQKVYYEFNKKNNQYNNSLFTVDFLSEKKLNLVGGKNRMKNLLYSFLVLPNTSNLIFKYVKSDTYTVNLIESLKMNKLPKKLLAKIKKAKKMKVTGFKKIKCTNVYRCEANIN